MNTQPHTLGNFIWGLLSESDGTPSASRLIMFLTFIVYFIQGAMSHKMPAVAELVAGLAPYAVNRATQNLAGKS